VGETAGEVKKILRERTRTVHPHARLETASTVFSSLGSIRTSYAVPWARYSVPPYLVVRASSPAACVQFCIAIRFADLAALGFACIGVQTYANMCLHGGYVMHKTVSEASPARAQVSDKMLATRDRVWSTKL
jgi:hypothetical protein